MAEYFCKQDALDYHVRRTPGKLSISITKPFTTYGEGSPAYTSGAAEPVTAIRNNPEEAYRDTSKGNLVARISNRTAVLGLGDHTGALASKPVLPKKFANVDVFDIEVDAGTPEAMIDTVARVAPTLGGINREHLAAPHGFTIEKALTERRDIPLFQDDQDDNLREHKTGFATHTDKRTLNNVMAIADFFIGLSGPDYIVPSPFDPRLIDVVPPAIATAAIKTGVARIPYPNHNPQPKIDVSSQ